MTPALPPNPDQEATAASASASAEPLAVLLYRQGQAEWSHWPLNCARYADVWMLLTEELIAGRPSTVNPGFA